MITADGQGYAPEEGAPMRDDDRGFVPREPYAYPPLPEPEPEPEHETDRDRLLKADRTARTERMIWRNTFLGLYVFGLLMYAGWALMRTGLAWNLSAFLVLMIGGLFPGLFLVAREQGEREVEHNRSKPESRATRELPGLRRPVADEYPDEGYRG